jgi:catechol 2,3-dioxygenase-like lactoylglutathione lyase family enzyme
VILGLHHAQITIPEGSEDAARDFYCRLLGLEETEKPESLAGRGGLWLQAGDRQVHLGVENGVDRNATKAHLAYEVGDLSLARRTLAAEGHEAFDPPRIPGYERFEIRDPFGNRIEFIQRSG